MVEIQQDGSGNTIRVGSIVQSMNRPHLGKQGTITRITPRFVFMERYQDGQVVETFSKAAHNVRIVQEPPVPNTYEGNQRVNVVPPGLGDDMAQLISLI